ncbi:MAG: metallophosphoesterase [Bacillota bacterium]|nr:metallophosphoesterase [Bacillota bacterium]
MKIYSISDLHLSENHDKPMDIFGQHWEGHFEKIRDNWITHAEAEDIVLMPGDLSWAMRLSEARADFLRIAMLPGKKVILRGNHDYWWSSLSQVRSTLPPGVFALQNDCFVFGSVVIGGSRGWTCPGASGYAPEDAKVYNRELIRMEMSLSQAAGYGGETLIAMIHFPPFNEKREPSGFTSLFRQYGVKKVVYGHLHDKSAASAFEGEMDGISYYLVSCDHTDFKLRLIHEE